MKSDVQMPIISVTAKPLIGPVPYWNRITAAMKRRDLTVEDRPERAVEALLDRRARRLADAQLLADALVDQHVGVDRHADGERDRDDAGQGQRRLEQRQHREHEQQVEQHRDVRDHAADLVVDDHEDAARAAMPTSAPFTPCATPSRPRLGPIICSFAGRIGAGSAPALSTTTRSFASLQHLVVGPEAAERDLAAAAADLGLDDRRRRDPVVEHDRHAPLHVAAGQLAEQLGALVVEVDRDVRLVGLRVVGDERVLDRLAGDLGAPEQVVRAPGLLLRPALSFGVLGDARARRSGARGPPGSCPALPAPSMYAVSFWREPSPRATR